jgi:hypothetical protein
MTNNTLVVGLLALSALVITLSTVYFIINFYESENSLSFQEKIFYRSNIDKVEKKIFIVGSSQVWRVNMTMINEGVSSFCNCAVYNLASSADQPFKRIKTIQNIISLQPDLVIYGLGYRDFAIPERGEDNIVEFKKPDSVLPDPKNYFQNQFSDVIMNPKLFTHTTFTRLIENQQDADSFLFSNPNYYPNPTEIHFKTNEFEEKHYISYNNTELEKEKSGQTKVNNFKLDSNYIYKNSNSIEEILHKLNENNIKIVLLKTPHSKLFIDGIPKQDQENYNSNIQKISKNSNVRIYDLNEKFMNMTIWSDPWHVSLGKEGEVYTKEFIKIIQQEMR